MTDSPSHAYGPVVHLLARMVSVPSISGEEDAIVAVLAAWCRQQGMPVEVRDRNLVVRVAGAKPGRRVLLNSHTDTVPPTDAWTRDPWSVEVHRGRLYGLGSNDAKASGAAMLVALKDLADQGVAQGEVVLALTCEEERGRAGLETILPTLGAFDACIIGEPTELRVVRSQKGLLIAELVIPGDEVHAAHAAALNSRNAILATEAVVHRLRDLPPLPEHPLLGRTTVTPTVITGGSARNRTPGSVVITLDCRTTPAVSHEELLAHLSSWIACEVRPYSNRLHPVETPESHPLVEVACRTAATGPPIGSSTMSDATHCRDFPTIKIGPGNTLISHQPDEYVEIHWLEPARAFYRDVVRAYLEIPPA